MNQVSHVLLMSVWSHNMTYIKIILNKTWKTYKNKMKKQSFPDVLQIRCYQLVICNRIWRKDLVWKAPMVASDQTRLQKNLRKGHAVPWEFSWIVNYKLFLKFHYKTSVLDSIFNKIKKRLQHKCFPLKITKFLRTYFFTEHLCWLLLKK